MGFQPNILNIQKIKDAFFKYHFIIFLLSGFISLLLSRVNFPIQNSEWLSSLFFEIGINLIPLGIITWILDYIQQNIQQDLFIESMKSSIDKLNADNIEYLKNNLPIIISQIEEKKEDVEVTYGLENLYGVGTKNIINANRDLYIFEKTPSLLLGLKPYKNKMKYRWEEEYVNKLDEWINGMVQDDYKNCIYLFHLSNTKNEIINNDLSDVFKRNVIKYKKLENDTGGRFRFNPIETDILGPIVIGDTTVGLWIRGKDDGVCITFTNKNLAQKFKQILVQAVKKYMNDVEIIDAIL